MCNCGEYPEDSEFCECVIYGTVIIVGNKENICKMCTIDNSGEECEFCEVEKETKTMCNCEEYPEDSEFCECDCHVGKNIPPVSAMSKCLVCTVDNPTGEECQFCTL